MATQEQKATALAKMIILQLRKGHDFDLMGGVLVVRSKTLIKEQKDWADGDESKDVDFSEAPYWIWGHDLIAITGVDDLATFLLENSFI